MPRGEKEGASFLCPSVDCIYLISQFSGRQAKGGHKGRNRRFVTEEEVRQQEEKKQREKEWKVIIFKFYERSVLFMQSI